MKKYFITAKKTAPLQELLEAHLPQGQSAHTILKSGGVWLHNKRIFDGQKKLNPAETLTVYSSPTQGQKYQILPEHICFEHSDFILVYKPPAIPCVSDFSDVRYNLCYGVQSYLKSTRKTSYVPIAITRLDAAAQGLVLLAAQKEAEHLLFDAVQARKIGKLYLALLEKHPNAPAPDRLHIKSPLAFSTKAYIHRTGKPSHSLFIKETEYDTAIQYKVITFTGRRHQIRCHAAAHLSPILGDKLYGAKTKLDSPGITLIATGFNIPFKGKKYRIRLPQASQILQKHLSPASLPH